MFWIFKKIGKNELALANISNHFTLTTEGGLLLTHPVHHFHTYRNSEPEKSRETAYFNITKNKGPKIRFQNRNEIWALNF